LLPPASILVSLNFSNTVTISLLNLRRFRGVPLFVFGTDCESVFSQRTAPLCGKNGCNRRRSKTPKQNSQLELGKVGFLLDVGVVRSSANKCSRRLSVATNRVVDDASLLLDSSVACLLSRSCCCYLLFK
jgi:hypothetical protein